MRGLLTADLAGDRDAVESLSPFWTKCSDWAMGERHNFSRRSSDPVGSTLGLALARSVSQSELSAVTSYGPSKALRDTAGWDISGFGAPNVGEAT